MSTNIASGERYLSIARVCDKLSRKKSWLYDKIKTDPNFPQSLRLGSWQVFKESQIDDWVTTRARENIPQEKMLAGVMAEPAAQS